MNRLRIALRCLAVTSLLLPYAAIHAQAAEEQNAAAQSAAAAEPAAPAPQVDPIIQRGKYLADIGNCVSCHTRHGGEPFAGGVAFETPVGVIYSTNITPDAETGIGKWTAQDLRRAMHEGIARDGYRLFPAFPYTSFTKVSDADVDAIYAYLRSVKAVSYRPPSNGFMFSQRWGMAIWNALFFEDGRYVPEQGQSEEWNRGAYLVQGLGHCSACHSPRGMFMAEDPEKPLEGGVLQDKVAEGKSRRWSAINLTSAKHGLGAWSVNDLTKYLQTGFSMRAGTFGPMNEVIVNSLKNLTHDDAQAMAVYLKSLKGPEYTGPNVTPEQAKAGAAIYEDRCEKCHSSSGRGGMFSGPPLAGSAIVQAEDPASLINIILYGPEMPESVSFGAWETMSSYGDVLDDEQIAAVANYIRGSWENRGRRVTAEDVTQQR